MGEAFNGVQSNSICEHRLQLVDGRHQPDAGVNDVTPNVSR
jgi:hypothetical protein